MRERLGIDPDFNLAQMTHDEVIFLLDRIYRSLPIQPPDSSHYSETLRLLQDFCSHFCSIPSTFKLDGVQFDRRNVIGQGGEATIYRGVLGDKDVAIREVFLTPKERESPLERTIIKVCALACLHRSRFKDARSLYIAKRSHTHSSSTLISLRFWASIKRNRTRSRSQPCHT
ncbi:hypothetical protein DL93DRAFT_764832 [Clavulina sp. PMI_390]|nr:hypothetical protein DL93DRAFT_764832 [Clavulina sp. PMI_390]